MLSAKLREHPNSGEANDYNPVHSEVIAAFGSGLPAISSYKTPLPQGGVGTAKKSFEAGEWVSANPVRTNF